MFNQVLAANKHCQKDTEMHYVVSGSSSDLKFYGKVDVHNVAGIAPSDHVDVLVVAAKDFVISHHPPSSHPPTRSARPHVDVLVVGGELVEESPRSLSSLHDSNLLSFDNDFRPSLTYGSYLTS